jgi:hypothetical protein
MLTFKRRIGRTGTATDRQRWRGGALHELNVEMAPVDDDGFARRPAPMRGTFS